MGYISIPPTEGHGSLMYQSRGDVSASFLLWLQITWFCCIGPALFVALVCAALPIYKWILQAPDELC